MVQHVTPLRRAFVSFLLLVPLRLCTQFHVIGRKNLISFHEIELPFTLDDQNGVGLFRTRCTSTKQHHQSASQGARCLRSSHFTLLPYLSQRRLACRQAPT